jgi:hypothetical protein
MTMQRVGFVIKGKFHVEGLVIDGKFNVGDGEFCIRNRAQRCCGNEIVTVFPFCHVRVARVTSTPKEYEVEKKLGR